MKHVLWISRHEMTPEQKNDLSRVMQDEIFIHQWEESVTTWDLLLPFILQGDVIAAVLPLDYMQQLVSLAKGKMVVRSVVERMIQPDHTVKVRHIYWQQILKITTDVIDFNI